jgi:uncharacterized protein (TIGR02001 family)
MKKTLVFALAVVAAGCIARGEFSLSNDLTFASQYVFRGVKLANNTLQPSVEVKSDSFYAGLWAALPIDQRSSQGYTDEFDFYVGFAPELSDTLSLDFGVTDYYYPQNNGDSTLEAFVGITADAGGFTPSVYLYHDLDLEVTTIQGSLGFSFPMESVGTSLDLSVNVGHTTGGDSDSYTYYGASVVLPYKLNDNATITLGLHWASNDLALAEDDLIYGTVGLTIGF